MYIDLKQMYWWPGMKCAILEFVSKCLICQQVKAENQVPLRLLNLVLIPQWKWEPITMDFVPGLLLSSRKKDVIWVVTDRLNKSAHFVPVYTTFSLKKLAKLYSDCIAYHCRLNLTASRDSPLDIKVSYTRLWALIDLEHNISSTN
ncbi:integrase [Gossypium australe]|uniref:Integrase n=1 Tax=Gossypium australe TaxID=47621 RepID=A0A5B6VCI5_9ROSI|nr:integrase [Gossypium australe]